MTQRCEALFDVEAVLYQISNSVTRLFPVKLSGLCLGHTPVRLTTVRPLSNCVGLLDDCLPA